MNNSRSDQQVVTDHVAGDPTALAAIYDRYADTIYDTAAAMLNDRDEAADVMQDVFLIASERLSQLRDRSRLKPWLFADPAQPGVHPHQTTQPDPPGGLHGTGDT